MHTEQWIVIGNRAMTDRAARGACQQVADSLGCDWRTVNRAVIAYGTALIDDPERIGPITTLGLDETAFVRVRPYMHEAVYHPGPRWATRQNPDSRSRI